MLVVPGYTAQAFALSAFAPSGPTFRQRTHGLAVDKAGDLFSVMLVVAGLVGTLFGGFAATAGRKRNRAGGVWTLGLSVLVAVPLAFGAVLVSSTFWSTTFLAAAMFCLILSTGAVNTLMLETAPVNLRASAMAVSLFTLHLFGDRWSPEIAGRLADSFGGNLVHHNGSAGDRPGRLPWFFHRAGTMPGMTCVGGRLLPRFKCPVGLHPIANSMLAGLLSLHEYENAFLQGEPNRTRVVGCHSGDANHQCR